MVMQVIAAVEHSSSFLDWKKKNPHFYLVHCFRMINEGKYEDWQVGYYSKEKDKVVTFALSGNDVSTGGEDEVFKEGGHLMMLDIKRVDVDAKKALEQAEALLTKEYPAQTPKNTILLLQHLKDGQRWTITFITRSFSAITVKVDAISGKIREHSMTSIFDFAVKK
ncbi:hypothetical protein HZB01_04780 [Candidatus Woesearchaeota archaeon]|nr:hypothetical protein [Candidatus Woesearchaeota archaeon]